MVRFWPILAILIPDYARIMPEKPESDPKVTKRLKLFTFASNVQCFRTSATGHGWKCQKCVILVVNSSCMFEDFSTLLRTF